MFGTELIRCEIGADHVATVTMASGPVNAQDQRFHDEMMAVFDGLSDTPEARAVLLCSAFHHFSAGAEIKDRAKRVPQPGDRWQHSRRARECFHSIMECRKPVVAAVGGAALGAGLALVASADIIVCADDARLGLPEINVGLLGGGRHSMRLFGHSRTRRMMFTGMRVTGEECYRLGVAEMCVPREQLLEAAHGIAAEIASKAPVATQLAKHALNTIEEMSLRDGYRFEQTMTWELSKTEDSREAMLAFAEKREPVFKGR
ncbi:MAG: enoyl-CoA hydratase/isomerase family protein [Pseudomonadota bacterium]|nr:enoyl-CoA hydratase/isomerase family protein [Pseudomonadota bacterium]